LLVQLEPIILTVTATPVELTTSTKLTTKTITTNISPNALLLTGIYV
jgi:hypothetical protein